MTEDSIAKALDEGEVDAVTSSIQSGAFVATVRKGSESAEGRGDSPDAAYAAARKTLPKAKK